MFFETTRVCVCINIQIYDEKRRSEERSCKGWRKWEKFSFDFADTINSHDNNIILGQRSENLLIKVLKLPKKKFLLKQKEGRGWWKIVKHYLKRWPSRRRDVCHGESS
jgi:hypothetical protein